MRETTTSTAPTTVVGRPRLHPSERRSQEVRVRLTPAEKLYVEEQAQAAAITPVEYVRRRALDHRVTSGGGVATAAVVSELNRVGVQLSGLGNVVNQVARYAHSDRQARGFDGDWEAILSSVEDARSAISAALDQLFAPTEPSLDSLLEPLPNSSRGRQTASLSGMESEG